MSTAKAVGDGEKRRGPAVRRARRKENGVENGSQRMGRKTQQKAVGDGKKKSVDSHTRKRKKEWRGNRLSEGWERNER